MLMVAIACGDVGFLVVTFAAVVADEDEDIIFRFIREFVVGLLLFVGAAAAEAEVVVVKLTDLVVGAVVNAANKDDFTDGVGVVVVVVTD